MNLRDFCKERGTNIKRVAEQLGIAPSTLYSISSGETSLDNVGISLFMDVAHALGCTADELHGILSGTDCGFTEHGQLTERESELLGIMRNVTNEGANQILIFARGVACTYPKNNVHQGIKTA